MISKIVSSYAGSLATKLGNEITKLTGPSFEPHVTLIGGVGAVGKKDQVLSVAQDLASTLKPIEIRFDLVESGQIFHQCVYILCQKSDQLMAAGAAAKQAFGVEPAPYMPHLSLLYSDIDIDQRKQIAEEEQQLLFGVHAETALSENERGFVADCITVWYTPVEDKTLESWQVLAAYPLQSN